MAKPARRVMLTEEQHNHIVTLCGALADLVTILNDAPKFSPATAEELEAARATYVTNELEIDDDAGTSHADEGYWVQAWVWVEVPPDDA